MRQFLFITAFLLSPLMLSEQIKVFCDYVEGSRKTGWEYGKSHTISSYYFMEETVVIDVDLEKKKIYFYERYTLPWIHLAYLRGKEIHFTTKITFNANTGEAHPIHESFSSWDEGYYF